MELQSIAEQGINELERCREDELTCLKAENEEEVNRLVLKQSSLETEFEEQQKQLQSTRTQLEQARSARETTEAQVFTAHMSVTRYFPHEVRLHSIPMLKVEPCIDQPKSVSLERLL